MSATSQEPGEMRYSAAELAERLKLFPPTPEQQAVIEAPHDQPLLVVAGAGSGKTETMAARIVWLIANEFIDAERILGLTFTRKAAGELAERIRDRLRSLRAAGIGRTGLADHEVALANPTVATYNSYAANLLSEHALRVGVEPDAATLSEAGQWQLAFDLVERWRDELPILAAPSTVAKAVLELAGACAEHLIEPDEVAQYFEQMARLAEDLPGASRGKTHADVLALITRWRERAAVIPLVKAYIQRKRDANLLDFGDQVALVAQLVHRDPQVALAERRRYGVVLLDEYQDTSHAQLRLLAGLFGNGHPVIAVGDPHQAIYGWRGASAGALERFPDHFPLEPAVDDKPAVPARRLTLSVAWRNSQRVLAAANHLVKPLASGGNVTQLTARPSAPAGEVVGVFAETVSEEMAAVAKFMLERRGTGASEVTAAVLCRTRAQFEPVLAALTAAGIPAEVVGLGGLLDTPEVADIVATLEVLHDPSRGDSLMRLLTGPRWRIGGADLHALAAWAGVLAYNQHGEMADDVAPDAVDERSIVDALDDLPPATWAPKAGPPLSAPGRERLSKLGAILRNLRSRPSLSLAELVIEVERALLLDIELAINPVRSRRAQANLEAFRDVAARFADTSGDPNSLNTGTAPTLGAFLAWLKAAQTEERGLSTTSPDASSDAVQVLTIHAAKGLEWDIVAITGLVEGTFPSGSAGRKPDQPASDKGWLLEFGALPYELRGDAEALPEFHGEEATDSAEFREAVKDFSLRNGEHEVAEERRLAYVAITRARDAVLLSGAWWGEGVKSRWPSRFFVELHEAGHVAAELPAEPAHQSNPSADDQVTAPWPIDHLGERRAALDEAVQLVTTAMQGLTPDQLITDDHALTEAALTEAALAGDVPADVALAEAAPTDDRVALWYRHAKLLLAEEQAASKVRRHVPLPEHLSASNLVNLVQDSAGYALWRRRPIPTEPTARSRRGTAFHQWVESTYGVPVLVDMHDLPGADEVIEDAELAALQAVFLASDWPNRTPRALEVDLETPIGGTTVRCRVDAVFDTPTGTLVVDWKTGNPPAIGSTEHRHRSVQLAVYRLAWANMHGVPIESVDAIFVHVTPSGVIEVPALPLDEAEVTKLMTANVVDGHLHFA